MSKTPAPPEARPGINWIDPASVSGCMWPQCKKKFFVEKKNSQDACVCVCFSCGFVLCQSHAKHKHAIPGSQTKKKEEEKKNQTVCAGCVNILTLYNENVCLELFHLSVLGCYTLSSADIRSLNSIKDLPDFFLSANPNGFGDIRLAEVTEVDLSPLCNVEFVGAHFLSYWFKLAEADLSPFSHATWISPNFLSCSGLEEFDFTPFRKLAVIKHNFLQYCMSLKSVDMKPLTSITSIDDNFLAGNNKITSLILPSSFSPKFEHLGASFLASCSGLSRTRLLDQIDIAPLVDIPDEKISALGNKDLKRMLIEPRFQKKRNEAIRNVNLIAFKSKKKLAMCLISEWVPRKLCLQYLLPVRK